MQKMNLDKKKIRFAWSIKNDFESILGLNTRDTEYANGVDKCVYVPIKTTSEQTPEEQEAILAHELIHIKEHHSDLSSVVYPAMALSLFIGVKLMSNTGIWLIKNHLNNQNYFVSSPPALSIEIIQNCLQGGIALSLFPYCVGKFSNFLEKRADCGAARALGNAHALISSFKKDKIEDEKSIQTHQNYKQDQNHLMALGKKCYHAMHRYFIGNFSSHPSLQERIDYLTTLQKKEFDPIEVNNQRTILNKKN